MHTPRDERIYVVANIHIYGAREFFLNFCDNQDKESELLLLELAVAGPIFSRK